ncbi:dihydrolipoyl dehydrogenase [Elysia marginata]|uniref:Dihydrolipoyl dehydrogenase n=1 Tax=Elysia marginata TaxID=1093978 RepID=A0AAV4HI24_9GAST|nr:dihydrolipoyl dehydrogenase [Elysia marginata]
MGGTCLNVGCIPSKSLLDSSHHYENVSKHLATHGINISGSISFELEKIMERKRSVVAQTCDGIKYLMKKNKIDILHGEACFSDAKTIQIKAKNSATETVKAKKIVIATGSKPSQLPFSELDKTRIITSTEALSLKEVPKHLVIIGGGVIGLELGQVYKRLGADVSVVEYRDKIIPEMDASLGKELQRILKKQGLVFYLNHKVEDVKVKGNEVLLKATDKSGKILDLKADYCLVAIGRKPYTKGLGLENTKITVNDRGQINTNEYLQTDEPNIYAIGDVIKGAMVAHKAEEEGIFVAETIAGQRPHINYNLIPGVVYTWPEVASVGQTEEKLKADNVAYKTGQFPMRALGRSRASGNIDGFVKILSDKKTDEVLGVHIIGARAADLIGQAVVAMEYRASAEDISRISHAHPTYSEAIKEAALDSTGKRAIHI